MEERINGEELGRGKYNLLWGRIMKILNVAKNKNGCFLMWHMHWVIEFWCGFNGAWEGTWEPFTLILECPLLLRTSLSSVTPADSLSYRFGFFFFWVFTKLVPVRRKAGLWHWSAWRQPSAQGLGGNSLTSNRKKAAGFGVSGNRPGNRRWRRNGNLLCVCVLPSCSDLNGRTVTAVQLPKESCTAW